MLVICCGFLGLSVMAVRSYTHPADIVELPDRNDVFTDDLEAFRTSLSLLNQQDGQGNEFVLLTDVEKNHPQIEDFVNDALKNLDSDEEVPFNIDMFIEAIDASHYYRGSMSMIDRLTMASWLKEYTPVPDSTDDYHRVIGFREKGERLAEVDLLFYSENNQSMSVRWFLVRGSSDESANPIEPSEWQVYDHARLEDGRRASDEYANYLKADAFVADGFDTAIGKAYEISSQWDWDQPDDSVAEMKKCESIRMLNDDRDIALLRFSYIYLENNQEQQAIRVLKLIQRPDRMWGVWPMLALCQSNLENFDEAKKYLLKAQQQAPGHPRNHWLAAEIESAMDHNDKAADHRAFALALMPEDTTLHWTVSNKHRSKDVPTLIQAADFNWKQRGQTTGWINLSDASTRDSEFANEVALGLKEVRKLPAGVSEMVAGSVAWANEDMDKAAKSYLLACEVADLDEIKESARENHQQCRLVDQEFRALLDETDNIDAALLTILGWAYDDEYTGVANKLLDDLKRADHVSGGKATDRPIAAAIQGWAHLQLGQQESALRHLDRFHQQVLSPDNEGFSDSEDPDWVIDFVDTMTTQCLLSLDRSGEVVSRFYDEAWRYDEISDWFIDRRDTDSASKFVEKYENETQEFLQLQVLKLKALLATSSGDVKESLRNHGLAVQLGEQLEENEENYWSGDLLDNQALDVVLMKAMPTSIESSNETFCQQVISEAESIEDGDLIQAWADHVLKQAELDPGIRCRIAKSLGDYELSQGNYEKAIESFSVPANLSAEEEESTLYQRKRIVDSKVLSQLAIGNIDSARKMLEEMEEPVGYASIEIAPIAIADLAAWNVPSLRDHLKDSETKEAALWFVESPRRKFFEQKSDDPQFDELLDEYPMPIGYHQPQQSGRIIFSSQQPPRVTQDELTAAVENVLGTSATLNIVATKEPNSAWIATSDAGDRILIGSGAVSVSPSTLRFLGQMNSNGQESTGEKQVLSTITIAILDYAPHANQRIFDISKQLVELPSLSKQGNRSIAFSHDGWVWIDSLNSEKRNLESGNDKTSLADQLSWIDRVPLSFQTRNFYFGGEFNSASEQANVLKASQWVRMLKESDAPVRVFAKHACGDVWEHLPAELITVDKETNQATVRLKDSSSVSLYLRSGKTCTSQVSNLRLTTP